jgi:hypothetical protein
VLGNDSDGDGNPLTAAVVAGPTNGSLVLKADGSFTYKPNAGFSGKDSFTYRANDGAADSNVATVTIAIGAGPVVPPGPSRGDFIGPTVVRVQRFGFHQQPTRLVLTFGEGLDPATASNVGNYRLVAARPNGRVIRVLAASYDPAARAVTLSLRRRLPLRDTFRLTVRGAAPGGLSDAAGNLLDGDGDGRPGGVFAVRINRGLLAGPVSALKARSRAATQRSGVK